MVESLPSALALGHRRNSSTPAFLTPVLRNIVISLARLPLANSYTRVPPLVSPVASAEDRSKRNTVKALGWGLPGVKPRLRTQRLPCSSERSIECGCDAWRASLSTPCSSKVAAFHPEMRLQLPLRETECWI